MSRYIWSPESGKHEFKAYVWRGERSRHAADDHEIRGIAALGRNGRYYAGVRHGVSPHAWHVIGIDRTWVDIRFETAPLDTKDEAMHRAKGIAAEGLARGIVETLEFHKSVAQTRMEMLFERLSSGQKEQGQPAQPQKRERSQGPDR